MATVAKPVDPMQEIVSVHIPRASGEDPILIVGLNGKLWNIPRGQTVDIPKPVADIIAQSNRNEDAAFKFCEEKRKLAKTVQGAPD